MMARSKERRCRRCRQLFVPMKPNHWYCHACYTGRPDLSGGHPVALRRRFDTPPDQASETTLAILNGLHELLSQLYGRSVDPWEFLSGSGLDTEQLQALRHGLTLDAWVSRFCPQFREWLIQTVGIIATLMLIDSYGLYGNPRRGTAEMAVELEIDNADLTLERALRQLSQPDSIAALEGIAISSARSVLAQQRRRR